LSIGRCGTRFLDSAIRFLVTCPTMRRFLTVLLAVFAAAPLAAQQPAAAPGANTYRSPAGFVLELPDGWVRAPAAAVDEVSRAAGTPSPGLTY
jgi:hypothetical protein